jgi:hypothetical protein
VAPSAEALVPKAVATTTPRSTLAFDHLERRFQERWKTIFERARKALQQPAT